MGGGEGWKVRCFVPLMHFCIGKYQSVPRLLAKIVDEQERRSLVLANLVFVSINSDNIIFDRDLAYLNLEFSA